MEKEIVKGFKVTDSQMKCHGYQFELGKEHIQSGRIIICSNGFHFCQKLSHCFNYYSFDKTNRVFEVEGSGDVDHGDDKTCVRNIILVRELSWDEVLEKANEGSSNTGHSNTGNSNTGNSNTGDWNTGDRNTGNSNTGNWNTGDWNTGDRNTGYSNTGDWNTGDRNTGYSNTGNWNTGDRNTGNSNTGYSNTGNSNTGDRNTGNSNTGNWNTGNSNTGDWNTGNSNTGNRNTGDWNTGDWNTGDRNTGNSNTGNWNTGDSNTGNWNTGYSNTGNWNTGNSNTGNRNTGNWNTGNSNTGNWNTGNRNTGLFCTETPPFTIFDKPSEWTEKDFLNSQAYRLMCEYVDTKLWVPASKMTDEEKEKAKGWETADGYVKDIPFKEAFRNAWHNWSDANKQEFINLPNFDAAKFEHITGVKVKI